MENEKGTLYLCATPIGNLEDMTPRAVRVLQEADLIAAEDTRHTRQLLTHFGIHGQLLSYHEHNKEKQGPVLLEALAAGKDIALVTDAGFPGISDPGEMIAQQAIAAGFQVVPVPGANACLTALVASGLPSTPFFFGAFLPKSRKNRKEKLEEWKNIPATLVLYEAPHRILDVLQDMEGIIGGVVDGGACDIGVESTIIDTTGKEPVILRPGGITEEMIQEVMGAVELDPGLVSPDQKPKAPGMKYRHYAPKAPMFLVEGPEAGLGVIRAAVMAEAWGLKVGVLALDETVQHLPHTARLVICDAGKDMAALAENLYTELREFDRQQVDVILGEGVPTQGLGLAIMNRMRKSAGHNILVYDRGLFRKQSGQVPEFLQGMVVE